MSQQIKYIGDNYFYHRTSIFVCPPLSIHKPLRNVHFFSLDVSAGIQYYQHWSVWPTCMDYLTHLHGLSDPPAWVIWHILHGLSDPPAWIIWPTCMGYLTHLAWIIWPTCMGYLLRRIIPQLPTYDMDQILLLCLYVSSLKLHSYIISLYDYFYICCVLA